MALDEAVAEDLMKEDDDLALSALELEYEAAGVVGGVVKYFLMQSIKQSKK